MYACVELDRWPFLQLAYTHRYGHLNIPKKKKKRFQFYVNITIFYPPQIFEWFLYADVFVCIEHLDILSTAAIFIIQAFMQIQRVSVCV